MNQYLKTSFLSCVLFLPLFLVAQFDPSLIASLSKLPPEQRERLVRQYGIEQGSNTSSGEADSSIAVPSNEKSTQSLEVEEKESVFDDLSELEEMIIKDIIGLEVKLSELEGELSDRDLKSKSYEAEKNALKKSKILLRRIKDLQLEEMERKTEKLKDSSHKKMLKPFGYDLFSGSEKHPLMIDAPVPAEYRIGPGDLIEIQLFGQRNQSYTLEISREGILRFPEIGPINVFEGGTKFIDFKNLLKQKITDQLGAGVQCSITLGAFRSINVFLLGEVEKQGVLKVSSMASVVDALLGSKGIKETGSIRKIQLNRSGEVIATIDLYDLLLRGDTSADKSLEPGDVIFVPMTKGQVSVSGSVRRPAKYELLGTESLSEVLSFAGGLDERGVAGDINLERLDEDFYPTIKSLNLVFDKDFKIRGGDLLRVNSAVNNVRNKISVVGAIEKKGDYEWKKGLKLNDLITNRLDFSSDIDLQYGLIERKSDNEKIICVSFIPTEIFQGKAIPLFPRDKVYFFSKASREEILESLISNLRLQAKYGEYAKLVRITGTVHFPGEYPLTDSMTVNDLIRAGGGTKDSAFLVDAEITRMEIDSKEIASVKHIRLDKNTFNESNVSKLFKLQAYDVLSIKPVPFWRETESIELKGEFKFPGTYSIKTGETLSEVIERAGGLTERAFPNGAIFSRQNLRVKEEEQRSRLIAQLEADLVNATLSATDSAEAAQAKSAANAMLVRLRNTESQGRLVIDLGKILNDNTNSKLYVNAGDQLFIPQIPYSVSVSGEVQFPTSHLYEDGLDLDDYLKRSGGYTQNADKDRTFVVKANGSVMTKGGNAWFGKGGGTRISAGDVIVVPIDVKQTRFLENLSYSTQIIYQLAVAAAAVNSF